MRIAPSTSHTLYVCERRQPVQAESGMRRTGDRQPSPRAWTVKDRRQSFDVAETNAHARAAWQLLSCCARYARYLGRKTSGFPTPKLPSGSCAWRAGRARERERAEKDRHRAADNPEVSRRHATPPCLSELSHSGANGWTVSASGHVSLQRSIARSFTVHPGRSAAARGGPHRRPRVIDRVSIRDIRVSDTPGGRLQRHRRRCGAPTSAVRRDVVRAGPRGVVGRTPRGAVPVPAS